MPKITNVEFQGASGRKHIFEVYTLGTETFNDVGGVYIFTKESLEKINMVRKNIIHYTSVKQIRLRIDSLQTMKNGRVQFKIT